MSAFAFAYRSSGTCRTGEGSPPRWAGGDRAWTSAGETGSWRIGCASGARGLYVGSCRPLTPQGRTCDKNAIVFAMFTCACRCRLGARASGGGAVCRPIAIG